jgi:O-methyltransferase
MSDSLELYVDLLKRCLTDSIYDQGLDLLSGDFQLDSRSGEYHSENAQIAHPERKRLGLIWPSRAHTMIGIPRLDNIEFCVKKVLEDGIPGDFIEAGVWRGGASIFMRGLLKAYGVDDRLVWLADSFEGLPPADPVRYPNDAATMEFHKFPFLAVTLEDVRINFARYGLLDGQVRFLKGWFRDTLPIAPIKRIAIMRLDGDLYESTMDGLVHLYPKLQTGGFAIIDDYNAVKVCNEAVSDFRKDRGITAKIVFIEGCGAFWRKETD